MTLLAFILLQTTYTTPLVFKILFGLMVLSIIAVLVFVVVSVFRFMNEDRKKEE